MCDCSEQLNQLSDRLSVIERNVTRLVEVTVKSANDTASMAAMVRQVESLFSEDNIMTMLGGIMGGGIPSIGG